MKFIPKDQKFYIRSMGKLLLVTGIFTTDDECNDWLAKNTDHGVVATVNNLVLTANLYDKGFNAPKINQ